MGLFMPAVAFAQFARIEVIHNCADAAAATVDVYANGGSLIPDFAFRTTTGWINAPAGIPLTIQIAPGNSTSAAQAFATIPNVTFMANMKYVIIATGIQSTTGYNPAPAFTLEVFPMGQEDAALGTNTDVLVYHGSTDAPIVDVFETGVVDATIIQDLAYGDFAGYLPLPTDDYVIEVRDETGTVTVKSYDAPLATLGLSGEAVVVVASGFLDPSQNSNGAAFGLFASTGAAGPLLPLPESKARVEIIHNCADLAASTVDVYLNGSIAIPDFAFRTTTGFIDLPAGVELNIGIAPGNSQSAADVIANFPVTLESGETYTVVATGIVSPTGYNPAPTFGLQIHAMSREAALVSSNTDVLVFHGSTDAPMVDVVEIGVGAGQIINDLSYNEFNPYLELGTADYVLEIQDQAGNGVVSYSAPLATLSLDGAAVTVVASGFLVPGQNSGGPGFGLFASTGSAGTLLPLPIYTVSVNEADAQLNMNVYPNPSVDVLNVVMNSEGGADAYFELIDVTGRSMNGTTVPAEANGQIRAQIDATALPVGIYTLRATTGSTVVNRTVAVQR